MVKTRGGAEATPQPLPSSPSGSDSGVSNASKPKFKKATTVASMQVERDLSTYYRLKGMIEADGKTPTKPRGDGTNKLKELKAWATTHGCSKQVKALSFSKHETRAKTATPAGTNGNPRISIYKPGR